MESKDATSSKKMVWLGWIASVLPVLLLLMSAGMKLSKAPVAVEGIKQFGYDESVLLPIGVVELVCTILYVIPNTSVLGAILLTGYLGGATATHVRIADPFVMPILVGVFVWLGLFLRDARLRALIPIRR